MGKTNCTINLSIIFIRKKNNINNNMELLSLLKS